MTQSPEGYYGGPTVANLLFLASAVRTATGTGPVFTLDGHGALLFQCDLTAAATAAGDTLDVYVQTTIDGTNFLDAVHFTQMLGNGGAKRYISKLVTSPVVAEYETGTALAAASVRHMFGSQWRVRWVIANASAPSFTFSVAANGT